MDKRQPSYKVWWDEKEAVGRYQGAGYMSDEMAEKVSQDEIALMEQKGKINWLIDLSGASSYSAEAKKIFAKTIHHPNVNKIAFIGSSTFIKIIVQQILESDGKLKANHFLTEGEAFKWLRPKGIEKLAKIFKK